jgi:cyclase
MTGPRLRQIAAGVHAWIGMGGDSNAGAVETPHGVLVVDAQQSRALGEALHGALRERIDAPIRAVVNTHYHLDHVAGNVAFGEVPIVGHLKTMQALERDLAPYAGEAVTLTDTLQKIRLFFGANFEELVPQAERTWFVERVGGETPIAIKPPSEGFADRLEVRLRADVLHLEHFGPAHCEGDIVVRLERAGVVFLGDLFFHGRFPWFGDCDLDGWIATLDRVLTMDVNIVVPGHGEPATLREVRAFRGLLSAVRDAVAGAIGRGASEDAAVAEIVLADYAAMPRYREWMPFNIRAAYRYLRGS